MPALCENIPCVVAVHLGEKNTFDTECNHHHSRDLKELHHWELHFYQFLELQFHRHLLEVFASFQ